MKHIIYTLLTILAVQNFTFGQDRNVHLFHGHNGNHDSWGNYKSLLNTKCGVGTEAFNYSYQLESTSGLAIYVDSLSSRLQRDSATANDIAIGHSFGAAAARKLDELDTDKFGAFIAVGGPNNGAQLANSALNDSNPNKPSIRYYFEEGCEELVVGPLTALNNINNKFFKFLGLFYEDSIEDMLCNNYFNILLASQTVSKFMGDSTTVIDLKTGSTVSQIGMPKKPAVGIQATLSSPVHWNLFEDFSKDDRIEDSTPVEAWAEFNEAIQFAVDNPLLAKTLREFKKVLGLHMNSSEGSIPNSMRKLEVNLIVASEFFDKLSIFQGLLSPHIDNLSEELMDGAKWLENSECGFHELLGAGGGFSINTYTQMENVYLCNCWCNGNAIPCDDIIMADNLGCDGMMPPPPDFCAPNPADYCWDKEQVTYVVKIKNPLKPNDGVVPLVSQNLKGALRNVKVEGESISHFQEPRNQKVWERIDEQLKIESAPNPKFRLENCNLY